jgi:two-component system, OmpR family, sensor kinase
MTERAVLGLDTLEQLLALPAADLVSTLTQACNLIAKALRADKVDAFLYDEKRASLVAIGTSTQPLSDLQKRVGLDVLPLANGGRVVFVYQTGQTYVTGHLEDDEEELRGVKHTLKIRSKLGVPLEVGGRRRGMVMVASLAPDHFATEDVRFAESVARWVGMAAHRAELVEEIARNAVEQGRRTAAEQLITVLAHDLRNLMAPIQARLMLLQSRATKDERKSDIRDSQSAMDGLERLGRLVSGLLDVARIEQGLFEVNRQPLDLAALAGDVARLLGTPDHPVEVAASSEVIVHGDGERVRQCLENLVTNAIQHSPASAPVMLIIRHEPREDAEWVRLEVRDQGPGVPPDVLPHIFDRFVTSRRSGGLGLGLYLARSIAAAHGGELTVESPPGQGTCFTLRLPAANE